MIQQDSLEAQLEAANDELRRLQSELKASQKQIARLLDLISKHQEQLNAHESSIARLDRILMDLLTGGTWRTLQATAKLVKKLVPSRSADNQSVALSGGRSYLICEEPNVRDKKPRSGDITVKGWSLAERGVDLIRVEVPGLPALEAVPAIARPDVKKAHPDLDTTGHSGFVLKFDSLTLPNGRHPITIRAISTGMPIRETRTYVTIDHQKGFASDYDRWIYEFERHADELIQVKIASISSQPLVSILMPVYNTDLGELNAAIQSVIRQSYENWELCIADDCSPRAEIREALRRFAAEDKRIKIALQSERGGISKTCNAARQMATGDYIAFLDHDDTLAPHALAHVCETLDRCPDADLLYSDEDKIDRNGNRFDPFFKPNWSPDLLLSENYICHLLILRSDLAQKIGQFNSDCDGSQDYDLILRATEKAQRIEHIPQVLYHWRAGVGSTAATIENKTYALDAAQEALRRYCERSGRQMSIEPGKITGRWRARYAIPESTRVSIIIASGGNAEVLTNNLRSLVDKTTFKNYEIVVIDNSKNNTIENLVRGFRSGSVSARYIDWRNKAFNYSLINNTAARQCESPLLLFLNDDISVIAPEWLEAMAELIVRPEVGAVGAKLLYPNGKIQHAGVVMGVHDNCGHAFKGLDGSTSHYFDFSDVIRNVSAVTGACLMTRADVFWQAGGFDETDFAVAFNDVDLCLKIGKLGYRVLYTPYALLYHHEAFSKTSKDLIPRPEEVVRMQSKWEDTIAADPYYSPNLSRNDEDFSLRVRS